MKFLIKIILPFLLFLSTVQADDGLDDKVASLKKIVDSIEVSEKRVVEFTNDLKKAESQRIKDDLEHKIKEENTQINNLKTNLNLIVSETDPKLFEDSVANGPINWTKDLEELLSPLITETKRLTSRPRELDRLYRRISFLKEIAVKENLAIEKINKTLKIVKEEDIKKSLDEVLDEWKNRKNETSTLLSIAEQKLRQLETEKQDISKSIKEIPNIFFRSRGKNLLLAILATVLFWLGFRRSYNYFTHTKFIVKRDSSILRRTLNLSYLFFSGSGSLIIFILVLFLLGDWLLLILSLMLVLGIFWTTRQALSQFWAQGALLLNIGPVREGERVEINGVAWQVGTINLYSTLKNPCMSPSTIRIPLSDLASLRSRPEGQKEPWFPTKEGDWVLINNELHGRVVNQTPSQIILVLLGGSRATYDVASFLSANPLNLSGGFRINKTFGFDYEYQKQSTNDIPSLIKPFVEEGLGEKYSEDQFKVTVELSEASASTLDMAIIVDFSGELASQYETLQRLISRICVDACNKHGWEIPFNQLTVHMKN
jgi:hypothetical protein